MKQKTPMQELYDWLDSEMDKYPLSNMFDETMCCAFSDVIEKVESMLERQEEAMLHFGSKVTEVYGVPKLTPELLKPLYDETFNTKEK